MNKESDDREPRGNTPRIYTRFGDAGRTRLASGREIAKNDPRLDAYGTLDELQAAIGGARDALALAAQGRGLPLLGELDAHLVYIQHILFALCTDLATPLEERRSGMPRAGEQHLRYLENLIDHYERELPPLREFILPGGHPAATAMHVCRVICRRAERRIEDLAGAEPLGEWVRPVVNRLSDAFYILARRVRLELERAGLAGPEQTWKKDLQPPKL